jgi:hypothetical protein
MFDLHKDIDKYGGVPPYASELYGVYQPLLGWQSKLTKKWIQGGGPLLDPRVKQILNGRILPGPAHVAADFDHGVGVVTPLEVGSGKSPYIVFLGKELGSELLVLIRARVQAFVDSHAGHLPDGQEWREVIDINNLMDADTGDLRIVNDTIRDRLYEEAVQRAAGRPIDAAQLKAIHLDLMQFESQMAAMLVMHAEGQAGYDPNELAKMFFVREAPPLSNIFRSNDPLSIIDPNDRTGALSPVGFVHLFRQFFFDLGTFLGEPVEHVWLSPGATIELIEVSTRRVLIERTQEMAIETTTRAEQSTSLKDELSDAVKEENETSTKLGVSATNSANLYVYQGSVTTSFGVDTTRRASREQTHKQNREQSEKHTSELKQSFKSVFKTVTETTDLRSRRHVIQNPGDKLLNYELRRKMRRVGVQVQDIGTRLSWQVFIDNPGLPLGLSELVHFAESPDLANLKPADHIPLPTILPSKVVVPLQFKPILDYSNNRAQYEYFGPGADNVGRRILGHIVADEDDDDSEIVFEFRGYKFDPPQTGYRLTRDVRLLGVQGNKMAEIKDIIPDLEKGTFDIIMQRLNFGGENTINLDMQLNFEPTETEKSRVDTANKEADKRFDAEKSRLLRKSFMESVRQRIKDASNIRSRPSWDLREEERTVVYRKLIERLMLDSWKVPDTDENRRLSHVRSEAVRAIFDVDSMLYFVAPEWWMPRRHQGHLDLSVKVADETFALSNDDVIKWGGEKRPDNYKITEDSTAARLGSSLGWLLQLDGDNLRNAFLNAPWVKAVIPIRPGREKAALNWLRAIEGHDDDGWETPYLGTAAEDAQFQGMTVGQVLDTVADALEQSNGDIASTLEADKVFEHGFSHLAGGFDAGLPANQVFSQWISVVPTDQIVAVEYQPTSLLEP